LATYTETLLDGTSITNRGQLSASFLLKETHVYPYSISAALGAQFLIASGKLQFNGSGWSNGIATWAGGFVTPPSAGWWQYYVDVQSILNGPPTGSFSITPRSLKVGNFSDPQPTAAFPINSFPIALVQSNGPTIQTLLDVRSLPATTFETVSGVSVSEPVTNTSLRAQYIDNYAVPQAWQPPQYPLWNGSTWWPIAGNSDSRYSAVSEWPGAIKYSSGAVVFQVAFSQGATLVPFPEGQLDLGGPFWLNGYGYLDHCLEAGRGSDVATLPGFSDSFFAPGDTAAGDFVAASTVVGIDIAASNGRESFVGQAWNATSSQPADTFALYRADVDNRGRLVGLTDMRPASPGPYTL
jgi:hypothetical protein